MNCVEGLMEYFKHLEKDFHHHYIDILQDNDEDSVHQLRVNMKRQMAFFRLLEHLDNSFSTERALEAYGNLYDLAGEVRDYEVERSIVREDEKLLQLEHRFSDWLEAQEHRQREKLKAYEAEHSLLPVRRLGYLVESRIRYLPMEGLKERFNSYFKPLFDDIRGLAGPENRSEAEFHKLRKLIKELFYNLQLISALCTVEDFKEEDVNALNDFQHLLGNWHDSYFTLSRIRKGQDCSEALQVRLEEERVSRAQKIVERLDELIPLMNRLESQLQHLLEQEPLEHPHPSGKHKRQPGSVREAFKQWNVGERAK